MKKVSVIIPVYNVEKYLRECLDSVVNQTLRDIEIICVDDGSTDGSFQLLGKWAARDSRIRVIRQEHAGVAIARNRGMDLAKGKYVWFVDPDDALVPGSLTLLVEMSEANETDVTLFCCRRYGESFQTSGEEELFSPQVCALPCVFSGEGISECVFSLFRNGPAPWNKFFQRQFLIDFGLRFQSLPRVNDLRFSYAALAFARRMSVVNKALYMYRDARHGSAQNSTDKDPSPVCQAYAGLKDILLRAGKFDIFAKSFHHAFFHSCEYTIGQLREDKNVEGFRELLFSSRFADIVGERLSRCDFPSDEAYARYVRFWRFNERGRSLDELIQVRCAYTALVRKADVEHAEVLKLRENMRDFRKAYASLAKKADAERAEVLRLRGELGGQRGAYASLAKKADAERAEVLRLRGELGGQRGAYASLAKKADADRTGLLKLSKEMTMLSKEVIRQTAELHELRKRPDSIRSCISYIVKRITNWSLPIFRSPKRISPR